MTRHAGTRLSVVAAPLDDDPPLPGHPPEEPDEAALLDAVLTERDLWPVLEPVIELETGAPSGYEAVVRGPVEHPLRLPDALYTAARQRGRLAELDALCRERAAEVATMARMRPPTALFMPVGPASFSSTAFPVEEPAVQALMREQGVHVVVQISEEALVEVPAGALAFATRARSGGCGVALDGVGARSASLALMPLLRPDVVKLDLSVLQDLPDPAIARVMTAVTAYAEEHAAVVVAVGVERGEHERGALGLGATHAQGDRYGPPIPPGEGLLSRSALWHPIVPQGELPRASRDSAFGVVVRGRTPLRGTKRLLLEVARHLERQAADMGAAVFLVSVQDDRHFGRATRRRFAELAERAAFVAAIGVGLSGEPAPGVWGADIVAGDPLCWEWNLVVVGPHFAVALAARDHGDGGPQLARRFDYVLTCDRAGSRTSVAQPRRVMRLLVPGGQGPRLPPSWEARSGAPILGSMPGMRAREARGA